MRIYSMKRCSSSCPGPQATVPCACGTAAGIVQCSVLTHGNEITVHSRKRDTRAFHDVSHAGDLIVLTKMLVDVFRNDFFFRRIDPSHKASK